MISDSTGVTAEQITRSALVQFEQTDVRVVRRGHVTTPKDVYAVIDEAVLCNALILHTLVRSNIRHLMLEQARLRGVDTMDLMGPILDRLSSRLSMTPREEPGLYTHLTEGNKRKVEAVEFAFHHDDGQNIDDLPCAEIVLVGISRSMKTPTMLYLAYQGWFTANVPLILEVPPAPQLLSLHTDNVFYLEIADTRLVELRLARSVSAGIPRFPYTSIDYIRQELFFARELSRKHGWRKIDTTGRSVEEVAREILELHASAHNTKHP